MDGTENYKETCQPTPTNQHTDWKRKGTIEIERIYIWRTSLMRCSPLSYFRWQSAAAAASCSELKVTFSYLFFSSLPFHFNVSKSTLSEKKCAFPAAKRRGKQLFLPDAIRWMECKYVNHLEFIAFECSSNTTADTSLIYDIPLIMRAVEIISQAASSFQAATLSLPSVHSMQPASPKPTRARAREHTIIRHEHPHRNINIHTRRLNNTHGNTAK